MRIGVFVCRCGSNIAGTVDVEAVAAAAACEKGVVFSAEYQYMCSEAGQNLLKNAVKEHNLTGVVICSCSPRMHEGTFRKAAASVGLNPFMVEIANIREHCSWVHKDKEKGTQKAISLARAAIAKTRRDTPLTQGETSVIKRALVIGGGIAGIETALNIAEAGFKVDIVEKEPTIGGRMAQIDKTFPTLDCSACILTPKMVDAAAHENINIYAYSEIEKVEGFVGNFKVTIRKKAKYIDASKCTGCGECIGKCPSKRASSEFNMGLSTRTAVYIPFAQAVPNTPTIDANACLHFKTGKCGICQKTCGTGAVNFEQTDEIITEGYGAIVAATGFELIDANKFNEFLYADSQDVITSLELERIMNAAGPTGGVLERPSDKKHPKDIVFIQCVGSRGCGETREKPYCSKVCCMYTAKHAILIKDKYPDVNVHVFYIDVRTPGKNFDEFYRRAVEEYSVDYIKGMVGKVSEADGGRLLVQASDLIAGERILIETDMVVLATAIEPSKSVRPLATMLTVSIDTNGFLTEAHPKLRPVESPTAGVFLSGVCQGPKDIPETVAQAGAAAVKVICLLTKDKLANNACVAHSDKNQCNGCSMCKRVCPYNAIDYKEETVIVSDGSRKIRRVAVVNEAVCQGCGACSVACPSGAMDIKGFSNKQILMEVDAVCR